MRGVIAISEGDGEIERGVLLDDDLRLVKLQKQRVFTMSVSMERKAQWQPLQSS